MKIYYADLDYKFRHLFEDLDLNEYSAKQLCRVIEKHFKLRYGFKLKVRYQNGGGIYDDFFIILDDKTHTLFQLLL